LARLELLSVSKSFGAVSAVDAIDLVVEHGELFCLFGPPACGKSTILKLLLGLERPDVGEIRIDGRNVTRVAPAERDLAMVFQNLALFPHMTVRANLAFPLVERGVPRQAVAARMAGVAATLHIEQLLDKLPAHLSGGERQRVAIGRAFMREPGAYLLDEPLSALDARLREEMRVELKRLQRQLRHTFVHVTHDQEEAMAVADRMAVMRDGRIAQIGTPLDLYNSPVDRYVAEQLGSPAMNFFAGRLDAGGLFTATGQPLCVATGLGAPAGAGALIGVRPEDIAVTPDPVHAGSLAGEIRAVERLGAVSIIDVHIGVAIFKVQVAGQPTVKADRPAFVTPAPEKCHVFDAATGRRLGTGVEVDLSRHRTRHEPAVG
jgi:multiple sugar transport system ATP-binding protein